MWWSNDDWSGKLKVDKKKWVKKKGQTNEYTTLNVYGIISNFDFKLLK